MRGLSPKRFLCERASRWLSATLRVLHLRVWIILHWRRRAQSAWNVSPPVLKVPTDETVSRLPWKRSHMPPLLWGRGSTNSVRSPDLDAGIPFRERLAEPGRDAQPAQLLIMRDSRVMRMRIRKRNGRWNVFCMSYSTGSQWITVRFVADFRCWTTAILQARCCLRDARVGSISSVRE